MKKRTYKCKRCGKEVVGQGALAHLRVHGVGMNNKLADVIDQLELVDEVEVENPLSVSRRRKRESLMPASQVREVTRAIERHQTAKPVMRKIERHPTLEIVTDGERVGIVEWRDDLV